MIIKVTALQTVLCAVAMVITEFIIDLKGLWLDSISLL